MKIYKLILWVPILIFTSSANAAIFTDDFSGDLSNWTVGPSHLDSFGIVSDQLFIDGYGHLTGPGGWGVLEFNQELGSSFTATWDAKITNYDYANFVLSADSPWSFSNSLGYANNGYIGWLDIDDPTNPLFDVMKMTNGSSSDLSSPQRNIGVSPDIPLNQWFTWEVMMDNGALQVSIDGSLIVDTFDSQYASSNYKIGLSFGEDSEGFIDNLRIETHDVPEPSIITLFAAGLLGIGFVRRRQF